MTVLQFRAGLFGFPLRLGQVTSPLQHRRPVDPADPGEDGQGVLAGQVIVDSVHSAARSKSPSSSQALIKLQYTLPVE